MKTTCTAANLTNVKEKNLELFADLRRSCREHLDKVPVIQKPKTCREERTKDSNQPQTGPRASHQVKYDDSNNGQDGCEYRSHKICCLGDASVRILCKIGAELRVAAFIFPLGCGRSQ